MIFVSQTPTNEVNTMNIYKHSITCVLSFSITAILLSCDVNTPPESNHTPAVLTSNHVQPHPQPQELSQSDALKNPLHHDNQQPAPVYFKVKFTSTKGVFTVESLREWAPYGVDRFYSLAKNGYYTNNAFFRVVPNFIVQFGINPNTITNSAWDKMEIQDDTTVIANTRGTLSYGTRGPNTRTTHLIINFHDNSKHLDPTNPVIARVIEGMDVVDKLYSGYGDLPQFGGNSPDPQRINREGSAFLKVEYPQLDYILSTEIIEEKNIVY